MPASGTREPRAAKPFSSHELVVNKRSGVGGNGMTQYGRALHELGIEIMCANTPAAKGRVERTHGTLQDRLVKEMRLEGISTIADANEWIDQFLESHNARFRP